MALPTYLRFKDLKAAGIVNNWMTLERRIKDSNFPKGRYLGKNHRLRAWTEEEVMAWIKTREAA
jgi:predicted DNA-binding transcriptional regulator AlpA